jgi:tetratricopeptide (TPR) repeat protein
MNFGNAEKTREGFTRGLEALAAAQRFERTHTGDLLELYCKAGLGQATTAGILTTDVQPTAFADFLFIGVLHQWLGREMDDPISRFVINRINSPIIDLITPLATSERYLRKAITFYPDYPWTYLMLAWTLDLAGKHEDCELALRAQLALDPDQWFGYFSLAHAILAQRRANDTPERKEELIKLALREIQPIVEKRPSHWESYYFRGMTYLEAGKTGEAIADLEKCWQMASSVDASHPKVYSIQEYLGNTYLERDEYAKAIERFDEALRLYPQSVRLYSEGPASIYQSRGIAHYRAGNHAAALADYEQMIRLDPSASSYFLRGECHWLIGNLQPAIDDCTKALARNPEHFAAAEVRGQAYAVRGDWARAAGDFRILVEGKPAETWPRFWLALALLGNKDQAGYQKLCAETLTRFAATENPVQAADIALICSFAPGAVDDPARVVALAEKLLTPSKNRRERLALGAALLRAGRPQDALQHIEFAYPAVRPDKKPWVLACLFRGLCEHRLNRPGEAGVCFAPARAWYDEYLKAVQAGNPTKAIGSDLTADWQFRLQVELFLREVEAK